jgi:hypothetical protein
LRFGRFYPQKTLPGGNAGLSRGAFSEKTRGLAALPLKNRTRRPRAKPLRLAKQNGPPPGKCAFIAGLPCI